MPGFSFSLLRRRGSEDEAWAEGARCEMKTKIQCGSKEKQEGIDQKSMKKKYEDDKWMCKDFSAHKFLCVKTDVCKRVCA